MPSLAAAALAPGQAGQESRTNRRMRLAPSAPLAGPRTAKWAVFRNESAEYRRRSANSSFLPRFQLRTER
ncbi:MAG: hypothetical protein A2413_17915 [Treponema sp. RIFOXYC1_FULL_61_9]|nr:MAG: hypothetical protein A2413_17915 [Treponema sp. RIFOXYC1_FULL_61_9]